MRNVTLGNAVPYTLECTSSALTKANWECEPASLKIKIEKGLFENHYRVMDEALAVVASTEWIANRTAIHTYEDLRAARTAEDGELAEKLQAKSAVLVKNDIGQLPLAAKASYHLVLAWNALAALVFITMRNVIPTFFTTNAEVIAIASQLMVFAALYQLSDGIQNVSVGILRGIQDVKIIMPIAFVSYWLLNLPVGYLVCCTLGRGPSGLFLGLSFGLSAAAGMMILRIRRSIRRLYLSSN